MFYFLILLLLLIIVVLLLKLFWIKQINIGLEEHLKNEIRSRQYYNLLNEWVRKKNNGYAILDYFKERNIKNVAIYGAGELGTRLLEELRNSDLEISCFVEKSIISNWGGIKCINISEAGKFFSEGKVDAIIVTPVFAYDKIESDLLKVVGNTKVVSLEDVVFGI